MFASFRHGYASVRRAPTLALTIIVTLGIALAATALVFSFLNTFLLRPLPFADGSRIAAVYEYSIKSGRNNSLPLTYDNLVAIEERITAFSRLGILQNDTALIHGGDAPESINVQRVNAHVFPLLGAKAALGSVITSTNVEIEGVRTIVLSDALWRRRFSADPSIVGQTIRLGDRPYHVVGVMSAAFTPPTRAAEPLAWPAILRTDYRADEHTPLRYHVRHLLWGELASGRSLADADAELAALAAALRQEHPKVNADRGFFAISLRDDLLGGFGRQLVLLQSAVVLVLVVACFNCLCLLIARALQRRREFAVRLALGAARRHLFAQLFAESLWLALPAACLALALASFGLPAGIALVPVAAQPTLGALPAPELDSTVTVTVLGAAILISLLFSSVPLLQTRCINLEATLREGSRSSGSRGASRAARALAVGQISVALALLISAALLLRSQYALRQLDPGLPAAELDLFHVGLRGDQYTTSPTRRLQFFERYRDSLRGLPGVRDVGVASYMFVQPPIGYQGFLQQGDDVPLSETPKRALPTYVLPGTFDAIGLRLIEGRLLEQTDVAGHPLVTVINASLAARYWPGKSAIGQLIKLAPLGDEWVEIVGVVNDVLGTGNQPHIVDTFYVTIAQGSPPGLGMGFFIRHDGTAPDVRLFQSALTKLDPALQIVAHRAPPAIYARGAWQSRFVTQIVVTFAFLAVALALAGIYAVNSFFVERRLAEFGIRAALGATQNNILRLVLRESLRFTIVGLAAGMILAFAASRGFSSLLYSTPTIDSAVYLAAAALMTMACLGATLLPARRAAATDPIDALRAE
jgi:putative ABC transport system permease protein